jgi:hypothetical protein
MVCAQELRRHFFSASTRDRAQIQWLSRWSYLPRVLHVRSFLRQSILDIRATTLRFSATTTHFSSLHLPQTSLLASLGDDTITKTLSSQLVQTRRRQITSCSSLTACVTLTCILASCHRNFELKVRSSGTSMSWSEYAI